MRRELRTPRADWPAQMEAIGFHYHSVGGTYWDESRCYVFSAQEVDQLEAATAELHEMALNAAQQVVASKRYQEFAIPNEWTARIEREWQAFLDGGATGFSLFGRMDLSYDGTGPPKLLEYNGDTPTACLEASVAQWQWLQALNQDQRGRQTPADQFNSIHEKLIATWRDLRTRSAAAEGASLHFSAVEGSAEDWGNVDYLRDTATQAGWNTIAVPIEQIGVQTRANGRLLFVDAEDAPIERLFKLYPWEWLVHEEFGPALLASPMPVLEPAWKMLVSNKALLAVLWELYPEHPNLLPAFYEPAPLGTRYVRKPKLAREGANVAIIDGIERIESDGPYGREGFVYQALAPLPRFGEDYVVIGSWIIGGTPAGIGLREDTSPITRNSSRFVPHYFV